jgi:hypothetical protein
MDPSNNHQWHWHIVLKSPSRLLARGWVVLQDGAVTDNFEFKHFQQTRNMRIWSLPFGYASSELCL